MKDIALERLLVLAVEEPDRALEEATEFDVIGIGMEDRQLLIAMQNDFVIGKVATALLAKIYFPNG